MYIVIQSCSTNEDDRVWLEPKLLLCRVTQPCPKDYYAIPYQREEPIIQVPTITDEATMIPILITISVP